MPIIFEPKDLNITKRGGTYIATLANPAMLGSRALQVERIELEADAKTSTVEVVDSERFIYVISGQGQAHVGEQVFPLEAESVVWLEKDEAFYLATGANSLEVLLCHAPAKE